MDKKYFIAYKNDYSINDIKDMIHPVDVKYWHVNATYWQPEEEDIDYDIEIDEEFDKVVKIFSIEFINDDDEKGRYFEIEGIKYLLMVPWYEALERKGYLCFNEDRLLDDLFSSEEEAKSAIEEWQLQIADKQAWEIVENGEARSW